MKKIYFILLCICSLTAKSQIYVENMDRMILTGSLRTEGNIYLPVRWAKVELKGMAKTVYADGTGYFVMDGKDLIITSKSSEIILVISADGYETKELAIEMGMAELGVIFVKRNFKDINPITVNDLMPDSPENAGQTISNIGANALFFNDDALSKSANYQLGMHGYKMRGYDWRNTEVYMNGASFNDPETGYAFTGLLNKFIDITKKNSGSSRIVNDNIFYGDIGGYSNIVLNPLLMPAGAKVSYSFSNSLYTHSLDAQYATGKMASEWALTFLLSAKRGTGFIEGTGYEGFSYLFSAGKNIDDFHSFSMFIAGAPTSRGLANYSVKEIYEQKNNSHFNSAWGYYGKIMKNSRQNIFHQPLLGLSHDWDGEISRWKTSLLFSTGKRQETGLNWNGEPSTWNGFRDPFVSSEQICWDSIFSINRQSAAHSRYILDANTSDRTMISLNSVYDLYDWGRYETTGGIELKLYFGRYYNQVNDILGGSSWLNVDKFSTPPFNPDFYQFDIIAPDREIKQDGNFGHDYSIKYRSYKLWNIWRYYMGQLKFSLGASVAAVIHGYEGNIKNGKVQDSGQKTPDKMFFNFSGKAGVAYKINNTSNVEANVMYYQRAPLISNTYIAPRISGQLLPSLKNEKIIAAELNYFLYGKLTDIRISGYFTQIKDQSIVRSYYNDLYSSRMNMGISGLHSIHAGGEASIKFNISQEFKADFAAAYGMYKYASDPTVLLKQENLNIYTVYDTAKMNGLNMGNVPALAISAGGMYMSPWNLWLGLNICYSGMSYADENPVALGYDNPNLENKQQVNLDGIFTMNFNGGYSLILGKKKQNALSLNINIQNLFDSKNGVLGAYRPFGQENDEVRYAYMYGRTFYMSLKLWF
ncbi:MAG: TonB-dependent receptor [Prevotellaceae bacterium]|nr:TonB-dependent receptor [Prevotellaceae bacterium]